MPREDFLSPSVTCYRMASPGVANEKAAACESNPTKSLTEAIKAGTAFGTTVTVATAACGFIPR